MVFYQVAFPNMQLPKSALAATFGPLAHPSHSARPTPNTTCVASEGLT